MVANIAILDTSIIPEYREPFYGPIVRPAFNHETVIGVFASIVKVKPILTDEMCSFGR